MSSDSMHSGHRRRMRKRFLDTGGSGFRDHELMELMLYYVIPRGNTNETAHRLIKKFGSISAVLDADRSELLSVGGIGEAGASMIKLMGDLCRSYALSVHRQIKFSSYDELECYISDYFSESCSDVCLMLSLNMQLELTGTLTFPADEIFSGSISVRNIAETALRSSLHRTAVGINRQGKPPVPTEADYAFLRLLSETFTPLGIEICDYIIYGCGRAFSMRKCGAFSFEQ